MKRYYLITIQSRDRRELDYRLESIMIEENPIDWLADVVNTVLDRETHLVFYAEVTKEQYDAYGQLFG